MNYQGHEELREDMSALANAMDELHLQIRELEKKYHDGSTDLVDALAGAFARSVNKQFFDVYLWVLVFSDCFHE